MAIATTCPNIPDSWKGNTAEVIRLLGIDRKTLDKYAVLGKRNGGIDSKLSKSGRRLFIGKEVKRFWNEY